VAAASQPQQGQWQQPPPAQQPPQGGPQQSAPQWQGQPPQQPQWQGQPPPQQWQGQPPPQAMMQQPPNYPQPQQFQSMRPFPIIMQQRLTRLTGQMFLAPSRLYFVCESQKGGLAIAIGRGVGGLIGGALAALAAPTPGQAPVLDEPTLYRITQERPGSLVMEPQHIKKIKCTIWTRGIFYSGATYALPNGLDRELKRELGLWCQGNNVKSAGLS
jgi:hypothetical protein